MVRGAESPGQPGQNGHARAPPRSLAHASVLTAARDDACGGRRDTGVDRERHGERHEVQDRQADEIPHGERPPNLPIPRAATRYRAARITLQDPVGRARKARLARTYG